MRALELIAGIEQHGMAALGADCIDRAGEAGGPPKHLFSLICSALHSEPKGGVAARRIFT